MGLLNYLRRIPKIIRVISLTAFGLVLLLGFLITDNQLSSNVGMWLGLWFFGAVFAAVFTLIIYYLLERSSGKVTLKKLDKYYAGQGWCREMAQIAPALHPVASADDLLLALFITLMSEHYDELPVWRERAERKKLTPRQKAVIDLCRMREMAMNGRAERAALLFDELHLDMDAAYEAQPDFAQFREPRAFADDALVWYELAMGITARRGQTDEAEHYRKMTEFRISMRDEKEQKFLRRILAMELQYANGSPEGLHAAAVEMEAEADKTFVAPEEAGLRNNLKRMLEQAALFGKYMQDAAGLTERQDPFARQLPT